RIVLVDSAAGGAKREALARRKSAAALDRHRTSGSRETLSTHQGLSRNAVTEGASESVRHSAEGGQDCRSRLNLVAGRLTVPNAESRCNQLELGHPQSESAAGQVVENRPVTVYPGPGSRSLSYTAYHAVVRFSDHNGETVTFTDKLGFSRASFSVGQGVRIFY